MSEGQIFTDAKLQIKQQYEVGLKDVYKVYPAIN